MRVNGVEMKVVSSGWYKDGQRVSDMKEDKNAPKFTLDDVFIDLYSHFQQMVNLPIP